MAEKIPVAPKGDNPDNDTNPGTSNPGTSNKGGRSSSSNRGGGGGDPYLAAQRKAQRKAAKRYLDQAKALDEQIDAIKFALGKKGFSAALKQKLKNVSLVLRQQDKLLMEGYRDRIDSLDDASEDNSAAASDSTYGNATNRSRERMNAVNEAMLQGAGETDTLRAQQMSLRNWDQNQNEIERSRQDTLTSINSNLRDLNTDTRTGRANLIIEANSDKEQLWTAYYNQRSEALTNLGNIAGQQAELYGYANEQVSSKKSRKKRAAAEDAMGDYYDRSARMQGKSWRNPGVPKRIRNWDGRGAFESNSNLNKYSESNQAIPEARRPEGASLREW